MEEESLKVLVWCLESGFPAPVTEAMLKLARSGDNETLEAAWEVWKDDEDLYDSDFMEAVEHISDSVTLCDRCGCIGWTDDATCLAGGDEFVCESCRDRHYMHCSGCEEWYRSSYGRRFQGNDWYCDDCFDNTFSFCEDCDEYYDPEGDSHDHDDGCDCEAPRPRFTFPANGHGVIEQNDRLTIELPKGTIDDEGLKAIKQYIYGTGLGWDVVEMVVDSVGSIWQSKKGNFTRRLSGAFYKNHGVKLADGVISHVGNLARAHSSEGTTWHVELTRDLNGSASEFYHDDSCWWQSYYASRCCLKNWGGIGLRSYSSEGSSSYDPSGRAWVQPLNADLKPTHDALDAHAYVVFNGYGDLSGYVAARIIAHLSSRSYKKVQLGADGQYINNNVGYLVADEATCEQTESLFFSYDDHDQLDAHTFTADKEAAA